ncbi:putative disease resistance protein RGA1 [Silene latifolia]|uniref:putative disease resistance protein RGA1 n=1 Tax=Silene latifolia TaxID=37657 RepID=UPI003D7789CE
MDLATVLSIVQTILTAIQTLDQIKSTFSLYQYKDELERLGKTVSIVESVLVDADAKQGALSSQQRIYIEELKDAIYEADDVLDEFVTLVKQRKAVNETHNKLSNKVRSFLSHFSLRIHNLSHKVMKVNKKLDDIASSSSKFLFKVDNKPKRFIKPDSSSFVSENDIIGRDEDLEKVVGMLLNSDDVDQPNQVSSVAIVGMGGLGKTALAKLIYNDPRVLSAFQSQSWICIADQDQWNLTEILSKIVKELSTSDRRNSSSSEQMHLEIREQLGGKKYLLVLDDVWIESYHKWQDLEKILKVGASGSRILVTTRSKKTAEVIVGDVQVHELQGLPEEQSWRLFESMAFLQRQRENPDDELLELGKEIVKKCKNVPLAIRVVASLLRGEPKLKWQSFRDKELANISESDDTINNILRLSYHQLDFSLKSCFSYCALFPKDFVIDKQLLISLWMAQGYITTEYVGEEYFLILLQRCFFQDLKVDEWGEIRWFKIHDLLHDIAEQVVGEDISRLSFDAHRVGKKVRHLSLLYGFCPQETFDKSNIRTCVQVREQWCQSISDQLLAGNPLANWACLWSLDLSDLCAESLPESIGELFHLRYLNLSGSKMLNALPVSINKLVNLQTLDLSNCTSLQELPKDVSKLLDLSTLNVTNCRNLSHMPSGMDFLTSLHTLGLFVVGQESSEGKQCFHGLEGLRSMSNLKGFLEVRIWVHDNPNCVKEDHNKGGYLRNKERLKKIHIEFKYGTQEYQSLQSDQATALLEEMQPHRDLKELRLEGYMGELMPKWLRREDNSALSHLPNLVSLNISHCIFFGCLTSLGELPHLKYLTLEKLPNVEYMLKVKPGLGEGSTLFPRLKRLNIKELSMLKGWWPGSCPGVQKMRLIISKPAPYFPRLRELYIDDCPMLTSIPMSLHLKHVRISNCPEATVFDNIKEFRHVFKTWPTPRGKSRIISICDYEYDTERDYIDAALTGCLHQWMFTHGYTSGGKHGD